MKRTALALLIALPAASLAQGAGALNQARGTQKVVNEGAKRHQDAADAQLKEGDESSTASGEEGAAAGDEGDAGQPEGTVGATPSQGVPPPDSYTVRPGDTLWDLSGRFLNNPWYWPKVWSYNPEITNPHWIYPGNIIRFYPGAEEAPGRVEEGPVEGPKELEDVSKAGEGGLDEEVVSVAGGHKIGYVPPNTMVHRREAFITRRELEESGLIVGSFEEKKWLSTFDKIYVKFRSPSSVQPGQTYVLYRRGQEVNHPRTGDFFGYKTVLTGTAKVVANAEGITTLVITSAFDATERGDYVGPWNEKILTQVARKPNGQKMAGYIIEAENRILTEMGENHVVFVDKGKKDGVENGNIFTVVRRGDPYYDAPNQPTWNPDLPKEDIGRLMVVDAKEHASAAIIVNSIRELYIGDAVEMRLGGPTAAK